MKQHRYIVAYSTASSKYEVAMSQGYNKAEAEATVSARLDRLEVAHRILRSERTSGLAR